MPRDGARKAKARRRAAERRITCRRRNKRGRQTVRGAGPYSAPTSEGGNAGAGPPRGCPCPRAGTRSADPGPGTAATGDQREPPLPPFESKRYRIPGKGGTQPGAGKGGARGGKGQSPQARAPKLATCRQKAAQAATRAATNSRAQEACRAPAERISRRIDQAARRRTAGADRARRQLRRDDATGRRRRAFFLPAFPSPGLCERIQHHARALLPSRPLRRSERKLAFFSLWGLTNVLHRLIL